LIRKSSADRFLGTLLLEGFNAAPCRAAGCLFLLSSR
jgi:hypothetical protein